MIILGEPNTLVSLRTKKFGEIKKKPLFRFDNNGEYRTNDANIIKKASKHFNVIDEVIIESIIPEIIIEEPEVIAIKRTCKTCGATFTNVGDFFAHAREHKRSVTNE